MRLCAAAFTATLLYLCCAPDAAALQPGDTARDFALRDGHSTIVALSDLRRGGVLTVLEIVNMYCDACRSMTPELNAMAEKYRDRGVRFAAVALANSEQEVAAMTESWGIAYPVLADPDKITGHLYAAARVPLFFIIDAEGIIRYRDNVRRPRRLQRKIDELLQTVPVRPVAGDVAPAFELGNRFGDIEPVAFALRNHNTIIGFFGADDEANRSYARVLARQYDQFRAIGLRVFAVLPGAFAGRMSDFISENELTFPVLIDRGRDVFQLYGVVSTPEFVIVNERGRIMLREHERPADELHALFATAAPHERIHDSTARKIDFLEGMLPAVNLFKPFSTGRETLYLGMDQDGSLLLARFVYKDIMCDVCTDVHYVYTLDGKGIIRHISLVLPFELHGVPVDASPFIEQFIGRRYDESFVPGENVDIVTGATQSSTVFINGLRETTAVVGTLVHDESFARQFKAEACFLEQTEIELALNAARARSGSDAELNIDDLAPFMPGGRMPVCPEGGTYTITEFHAIPRVGCSVHGLDPRSSLIH